MLALNELGEPLTKRSRVKTPDSGKPVAMIGAVIAFGTVGLGQSMDKV